MTEQERLEDIRHQTMIDNHGVHPGAHLSKKDWDYLIQQAEEKIQLEERVKELEEELHESRVNCKAWYDNFFLAKEETQRYKQALEFYANGKHYGMAKVQGGFYVERVVDRGEKAEEALKGDSDG